MATECVRSQKVPVAALVAAVAVTAVELPLTNTVATSDPPALCAVLVTKQKFFTVPANGMGVEAIFCVALRAFEYGPEKVVTPVAIVAEL